VIVDGRLIKETLLVHQ